MKPYLFRSVVHPGMWACMLGRPASTGPRKWEPVPDALIVYGANPRHAYERWLEYSKL